MRGLFAWNSSDTRDYGCIITSNSNSRVVITSNLPCNYLTRVITLLNVVILLGGMGQGGVCSGSDGDIQRTGDKQRTGEGIEEWGHSGTLQHNPRVVAGCNAVPIVLNAELCRALRPVSPNHTVVEFCEQARRTPSKASRGASAPRGSSQGGPATVSLSSPPSSSQLLLSKGGGGCQPVASSMSASTTWEA